MMNKREEVVVAQLDAKGREGRLVREDFFFKTSSILASRVVAGIYIPLP